jgi:hypothetical protein
VRCPSVARLGSAMNPQAHRAVWLSASFVLLAAPAVLVLPWGCSSSSNSQTTDASTDAPTAGLDGGTTTTCQGTICPAVPMQAAAYVTACCTGDGGCGGQTPLSPQCLPYGAPGGMDPSCPAYTAPTGTLPGCCRPEGQCGAYDGTLGLGCIANASLTQPMKTCNYAANDCTQVTPLTCDGPEDCPSGNHCCGEYTGGGYAQIECLPSCADAGAGGDGGGGLWLELCHAGQTCETASDMCLTSMYLPSFLYRCYTTGMPPPATATAGPGINCGAATCGAGQLCCLRSPHDPYCAPAGTACSCTGPGDAGADAADAGGSGADGMVPTDAGAGE